MLAGLGLGGYRGAMARMGQVKEFAAGKTLIAAYLQYAADHNGQFMVAQYEGASPEVDTQILEMPDGTVVRGTELHRYPYRLSPYFDYKINGTSLVNDNKKQIDRVFSGNMHSYGVSLCPAFGINYYFLGGYKVDNAHSEEQMRETAFSLPQVEKPSSLLVFATAFSPDVNGSRVEGRFGIEPPAYRTELWDQNLHVDPRHQGKALCAFLDGSLRSYSVDALRDMRFWSKTAQAENNPDYRVNVSGSTGIGGGSGGRR